MNGSRMSKHVGCNPFPRQHRRLAGRCFDVLAQPEAVTGAEAVIEALVDEGPTQLPVCTTH